MILFKLAFPTVKKSVLAKNTLVGNREHSIYVLYCQFGNPKCLFSAIKNSFSLSNWLFTIAANTVSNERIKKITIIIDNQVNMIYIVLFVFNIPVNKFSVILSCNHLFLGFNQINVLSMIQPAGFKPRIYYPFQYI